MTRRTHAFIWLVATGVVLLSGCATERFKPGIRHGMTTAQVGKILGKPDRVSKRSDRFLAYQYIDRKIDGKPLGSNYIVIFKDGRVEANGPGRLRENPAAGMGMFVIVPFR